MSSSQKQNDETTTVLIIGASVRAAAESARRAGWDIVASDMFGDTDLRRISRFIAIDSYPDGFHEIVRDVDIPTIYTGGLENHPSVLNVAGTLWGNRGEALTRVRDPFWWTSQLHRLGINTAEVRRHTDSTTANKHFLAKPLAGAGGTEVFLAEPSEQIESDCFFQEFIEGALLSAVFLGTSGQCQLCGVTRQIVWPGLQGTRFTYGGSVGPIDLSQPVVDQLRQAGTFFVSEAGLRGLFGLDFVLRPDGSIAPIEVNPRYTASVEVLEATLSNGLLPAHRTAFDDDIAELPSRLNRRFAAKLILYAARRVTIEPGFHQQILPTGSRLADIPAAGSIIEAGHPICTVLSEGHSIHEARDRAAVAVKKVHPFASVGSEVIGPVSANSE